MANILVVDDEFVMRDAMAAALRRAGHEVSIRASGEDAVDALKAEPFGVVITDLRMPGIDGLAVLEAARRTAPDAAVLVVTAHGSVEVAVEAMKKGACDFLIKPFPLDELELKVAHALSRRALTCENEALRARLSDAAVEAVWDASPAMREVHQQLARAAPSDSTVLITGESGAGKEVAAQALHRMSPRRDGPFLAVNCAALSAGLLESELFGHEKGAFTGAERMRRGRFELAEGGTLLLDEVSEIDPALQAKLLRVLQERAFERVGSSTPRRADVRVVATTHRDLRSEVAEGRFREDLYFRIHVLPIRVPPLRERKEEIPLLAEAFLRRIGSKKRFSSGALARLAEYDWPGNVRELGNIVERAAVLEEGIEIGPETLAPWLEAASPPGDALALLAGRPLDVIEQRLIELTVRRCGGNKERAARALGITARTVRDRLKRTASEPLDRSA
jgi:two-component system response regulator FlrC